MDSEQLRKIAAHHAQKIRTRCKFSHLADHHVKVGAGFIFYAVFNCKNRVMMKRIILSETGELITIKK